jgi:hypothetical protein
MIRVYQIKGQIFLIIVRISKIYVFSSVACGASVKASN